MQVWFPLYPRLIFTDWLLTWGGGSTEVVGNKHERIRTESYCGQRSLRDKFFQTASFSQGRLLSQMEKGAKEATQLFNATAAGVSRANWDQAYASSGMMKMLASICEEHGFGRRQISLKALNQLKEKMAEFVTTGEELPGLKERRRELLLPGWCIAKGLMQAFGVTELNFSATALREGMLDFLVKNKKTVKIL